MIARMRCTIFAFPLLVSAVGCGSLKFDKDLFSKNIFDQSDDEEAKKAAAVEGKDPEILPDTHLAAGRLHETQGRLTRAAEQYRLAIAMRPDNVEAYNRLGMVLDRLGRYREADDAFKQAIKLDPQAAYLHNNLAFSYIMQSKWEEARSELIDALEIAPGFTRARVNLAMVMAMDGKYAEAQEQFQLALPPEDAHYNMGLMYQTKRMPTEAARSFMSALAANPAMESAKKRLALLPADAVAAAGRHETASASPAPAHAAVTSGSPVPVVAPTTRPASSGSEEILPATGGQAEKDESISRLLDVDTLGIPGYPDALFEDFGVPVFEPLASSSDEMLGPVCDTQLELGPLSARDFDLKNDMAG